MTNIEHIIKFAFDSRRDIVSITMHPETLQAIEHEKAEHLRGPGSNPAKIAGLTINVTYHLREGVVLFQMKDGDMKWLQIVDGRGAETYSYTGALSNHLGSWHQDAHLENGNYMCQCCICNEQFIGHKRRVVCRVCSTPA